MERHRFTRSLTYGMVNFPVVPFSVPSRHPSAIVTDHGASNVLLLQPPHCNSSQVPQICAGAPVRHRPPMLTWRHRAKAWCL